MPVRLQAERKMKFATRALPAAAVAVALLVSACGSAGSGGSGSGGPSGTHAPATSTTSAGGGVMTLVFTVTLTGAAPGSGSFSVKYPPPPVRSCSSWFAASLYSPRSPSRWAASTSTWWSVSSLASTTVRERMPSLSRRLSRRSIWARTSLG